MKPSALWFLAVMIVFSRCASQPPEFSETEWYKKTQAEDSASLYVSHVDTGGSFFNPWLQRESTKGRGSWFSRKKEKFEEVSEAQYGLVQNDYSYLSDNNFNSITFAGHASMIIKMNGQTILTDPFFSNAALIVRKKVKNKFDFSKVPQNPVVLLSHNHYDHYDKYSIKQLAKKNAVFVVPLRLKKLTEKYGAKEVHELDWWQSVTLNTIEYTLLPSQHWSRRIGQPGGATLWGGYIIQGQKTIYFSGDSGYFIGFKEFGKRWNIDYAILGAGAYEPRWFMHYSHMNVKEFFLAAEDLKAGYAIPMHFGIISLSDEPLLYPLYEIDKAINQDTELLKTIKLLRVGEYLTIP
ncbi:MAG: MBL fold metallo-hydrolase [Treponema sp.]|jgi:L-ascorbate metabolism protein UlaG (beta-lactamase superfamily)|nr:MBL fold metallo-hydrolase [Treponema sp.]